MKKIVIALGGNALGNNAKEQREIVKITAKSILDLFEQGNKVLIVHGNGPQVGMINNAFADTGVDMPFPECGAMSQGYIGYHIQNAIRNEANKRGVKANPVTIITQTLVDEQDKAFKKPTKPIGSFYSKEDAEELMKVKKWKMIEDSGRGWRKVVPSPKPLGILEKESLKQLLDDDKTIIITGGGGGVPVVKNQNGIITGVEAVIDKDATSSKIAVDIKADAFIILTAVDKVFINFGKPNQKSIDEITLKDLTKLFNEGIFAEGSMKPKVEAVMDFVKSSNKTAYIADLKLVDKVLSGDSGTKITN